MYGRIMSTPYNQKILLGESGELLVASRFLAIGFPAGQLPRGYQDDDLIVQRGRDVVRVQVKSRVGPLTWLVGEVVGKGTKNRFYALVHYESKDLNSLINPTVYLVPSVKVEQAVTLHRDFFRRAHPDMKGPGVPSVSNSWRMEEEMNRTPYGRGWLAKFEEPWDQFTDGKLV